MSLEWMLYLIDVLSQLSNVFGIAGVTLTIFVIRHTSISGVNTIF